MSSQKKKIDFISVLNLQDLFQFANFLSKWKHFREKEIASKNPYRKKKHPSEKVLI